MWPFVPVLLTFWIWAAGAIGPAAEPAPAALPAQAAQEPERKDFQSPALLTEIDSILKRAAAEREGAKTLPSETAFALPPIWRETREAREKSVRNLLDGALEIITDAPVLRMQADLKADRDAIAALRSRIADLRERRLDAPATGLLPGLLSDTQGSIDSAIDSIEADIADREARVRALKAQIRQSIKAAGIDLTQPQADLLLDGVLGGDLLKLVAAFEVARIVDAKLAVLLTQSHEDIKAARRYFGMHAALLALLVHAQDLLIEKIDTAYIPRLSGILTAISKARATTDDLLRGQNRDDQQRVLEANRKSQDAAQKVARFYKDYLVHQRTLLDEARDRSLRDLAIADNTFDTVEASFQLRTLMDEAQTSFEALQHLDAPGFDQIFENKDLKREFENLTQRLSPAS
jgi:hypothetical protein